MVVVLGVVVQILFLRELTVNSAFSVHRKSDSVFGTLITNVHQKPSTTNKQHTTLHKNTHISKNLKLQNSKIKKLSNSKTSRLQNSRIPKIQKSKNPKIQKSKNPKIQKSKNPKQNARFRSCRKFFDFWIFRFLDFWIFAVVA